MSSTNRGTARSIVRGATEDMTWQGVRPKAPNLISEIDRLNMGASRQTVMPSIKGEQSVNGSIVHQQLPPGYTTQSSLTNHIGKEEPNFPLNQQQLSMQRGFSMQQAVPLGSRFATIAGSDDSIVDKHSSGGVAFSRKSSKNQMRKVDYSDISVAMINKQKALAANKKGRGQSLKASRFTDPSTQGSALMTMGVHDSETPSGTKHFNSIDVNFKRQIDNLKQNRANSMLPSNMIFEGDTPQRGRQPLQHNDSIYQSSVNASMNSGLGLTPKRLQQADGGQRGQNSPPRQRVKGQQAPFGGTEQKQGQRVPPILLANEHTMKYVGVNKHQTINHQFQVSSPTFPYSGGRSPSGGQPQTIGAASFLSREPGSTAYSQPEDSMFQASDASFSQQRSRVHPSLLPKIGTANPEVKGRFNRSTAYPEARSRDISTEQDIGRGRQLSTAQPKNGFKFSKSQVQSQQARSRVAAQHHYNDTGFNWKQVEIRTNHTNFDGTHKTQTASGHNSTINVPASYLKKHKKMTPNEMMDAMQKANHKGPISHKVVSQTEFDRLALREGLKDGQPMVEKTIFIVKPIYVPIQVPSTSGSGAQGRIDEKSTTGKKRLKLKKAQQKAIYMERPKPPNYTNIMSTALTEEKKPRRKPDKVAGQKRLNNKSSRSPSPFVARGSQQLQFTEVLNQSSLDHDPHTHTQPQFEPPLSPTGHPMEESRSVADVSTPTRTAKDFKQILESSKIIDQIFHERQKKKEAAQAASDAKKKQEQEESNEVLQANQTLKETLAGRSSIGSKMTLAQQMSVDPSGNLIAGDDNSSINAGAPPVDTTAEFVNSINHQLHGSGAGIQIIVQESRDAQWFKRKQKDEEKINKEYGRIRKWEVAPETFASTELTAGDLARQAATNAMKKRPCFPGSAVKSRQTSKEPDDDDEVKSPTIGAKGTISRTSIPKFQNSPQGGQVLSERRWQSPVKENLRTSQYEDREFKSPFTVRSVEGGRNSVGSSNPAIGMISVQDQQKNQLSLERVEAMKLMTKKMKKVAKIPIEMENKFCSHIDPATSAQLIAAEELARQADPKNKFKKRWEDREFVELKQDTFSQVPRRFYTNYKTNLIRDAHYMAKNIVMNRSQSPISQNLCLGACGNSKYPGVSCGCQGKQQKVDISKRFRSFIGGIRSNKRSKAVFKNAYNLHKPYRPCRRTCCADHNPMFHAQRMQREHLQRMHASATKLMIMSVVPERPYSADSATRALRDYQKEIDFYKSTMHGEAIIHKQKTLDRKKSIRAKNSIEGIEERSGHEEEDKKSLAKQSAAGQHMMVPNSTVGMGELTQSGVMLLNSQLQKSMNADDLRSLTALECKYLVSVLKNRSVQASQIKEKQFEMIYAKARTTLKIQMKKLLLKKQFYMIDRQYKLAENEKQTSLNLIKILSRCLKMFDAQSMILKIINLITARLEKLKEFKIEQRGQTVDETRMKRLYVEIVRLSGRVSTEIRVLKSIEKALSRPFMFAGKMYDGDHMHHQVKRKRLQVLGQFPNLVEASELRMFIKENGDVSDVRRITREEYELKEDEELWSESSSEDEDGSLDGFAVDPQFTELNASNDGASPERRMRQSVKSDAIGQRHRSTI